MDGADQRPPNRVHQPSHRGVFGIRTGSDPSAANDWRSTAMRRPYHGEVQPRRAFSTWLAAPIRPGPQGPRRHPGPCPSQCRKRTSTTRPASAWQRPAPRSPHRCPGGYPGNAGTAEHLQSLRRGFLPRLQAWAKPQRPFLVHPRRRSRPVAQDQSRPRPS